MIERIAVPIARSLIAPDDVTAYRLLEPIPPGAQSVSPPDWTAGVVWAEVDREQGARDAAHWQALKAHRE